MNDVIGPDQHGHQRANVMTQVLVRMQNAQFGADRYFINDGARQEYALTHKIRDIGCGRFVV